MDKENDLIKDTNDIKQRISAYFSKHPRVNMSSYVKDRLDNLLAYNKFKHIFEPRAFKEFNMKPFVRKENKLDAYVGFIIKYGATKYEGSAEYGYDLYKVKTNKGNVYFVVNGVGSSDVIKYTVWTTHFFERYYERIFDRNVKRPSEEQKNKAIIDFIKNILNLCLCPNPLKRPSMSKILELINTV